MVVYARLYLSCAFFMALTQVSLGDAGLLNGSDAMTFLDGVNQAKEMAHENHWMTQSDEESGFSEDEKPLRKRWDKENPVTTLPDLEHNEDEKPLRKRWDKENPVTTLPDLERNEDDKPMRRRWDRENPVTSLPDLERNEDDKPMRRRWDRENPVTSLSNFDGSEEIKPSGKHWDLNKPLTQIQNMTPNNPADLPTMAQMRANKKSTKVDDQKLLLDQKKKLMRALSKLEDAPMPSTKALRYDRNRRLEIMRREMAQVDEQLERTPKRTAH